MPRRAGTATLFALAACTSPTLSWGTTPEQVAAYRTSFTVAAGTRFVDTATAAELLRRVRDARVLWLGDHHVSTRLHVRQRALLAAVQRTGRPLLLALEAIGEQDEPRVAQHLAGRIDAPTLRAEMLRRWPGSWLDDRSLDAAHYRALVVFAREHSIPVLALEPTPRRPLVERDAPIAARVRALAAAHPERLVVVVVGQTHLLGDGDLVGRAGLTGVVVGGEPTAPLRAAFTPLAPAPGTGFVASDGGVWWFVDLLRAAP